MSDRSERISRLKSDRKSRESYINSKISVLVPSQIKALRLKSSTPQQAALAKAVGTHQSRLSDLERPGESNVTLETLAWIAAIHKVGLVVKFVPFSEMLRWENGFSQDTFTVTPLDEDMAFLSPGLHLEHFGIHAMSTSESSGDKLSVAATRGISDTGTEICGKDDKLKISLLQQVVNG